MVDSSSAALLSEIEQKKRRTRAWPLMAALAVLLVWTVGAAGAAKWIVATSAVFCLVGVFAAYQFDLLKKTVVIMYDFDTETENAYQRLHDCVLQLASCGGKWNITARGNVSDPKYHAGAGQVVNRTQITVGTGEPPYFRTNISVPLIRLGARTLYFFPERLLVFSHDGVGAVGFGDFGIAVSDKRFIEEEFLPQDAQVVDHTWRYVNKDGGPDRRFKDNRQLPICLYEELWLKSSSGLNEIIQISRTGVGQLLNAAIENLAEVVAKAAAQPLPAMPSMESKRRGRRE